MKKQKFSIRERLKSFKYALNGIKILLQEEHNSRIHLIISVCVVIAGFLLHIAEYEWIALVFAIGLVITLEIVNSVIENLADFVSTGKHEMIKKIKDLSAAAVLLAALTSVVIGFLIFLPKIINLISN